MSIPIAGVLDTSTRLSPDCSLIASLYTPTQPGVPPQSTVRFSSRTPKAGVAGPSLMSAVFRGNAGDALMVVPANAASPRSSPLTTNLLGMIHCGLVVIVPTRKSSPVLAGPLNGFVEQVCALSGAEK